MAHQWISKAAPIYVWGGDTWIRETDLKHFNPNIQMQSWESSNGERVSFTKKSRLMDKKSYDY